MHWLEDDPAAWDAFVERAPYSAFTQLSGWGALKGAGGWSVTRLAVGPAGGPAVAGVQLLSRHVPVLSWRLAYAPRGPVGELDDAGVRDALLAGLRAVAAEQRIATLRADPETGPDQPYGAALLQRPWRAARGIQAPWTRLVDLTRGEAELRAEMRAKHRQYVTKAQRGGVIVEHLDPAQTIPKDRLQAAFDDFYAIVAATARRTGFTVREQGYYERAWHAFAPAGRCRIYFALVAGKRVATIFHFLCGRRAVEAWGGMIEPGGPTRANYLLKWQAMMDLRAEGFATYDMWGIASGGIRQFKEGFGGRAVRYVGARELALSAVGDRAVRLAVGGYGTVQRLRARLRGEHAPASAELV
jgi:lipid II:glycine glycyltransferase (peptidoglycan interpeptide bridge formation enzyme)